MIQNTLRRILGFILLVCLAIGLIIFAALTAEKSDSDDSAKSLDFLENAVRRKINLDDGIEDHVEQILNDPLSFDPIAIRQRPTTTTITTTIEVTTTTGICLYTCTCTEKCWLFSTSLRFVFRLALYSEDSSNDYPWVTPCENGSLSICVQRRLKSFIIQTLWRNFGSRSIHIALGAHARRPLFRYRGPHDADILRVAGFQQCLIV